MKTTTIVAGLFAFAGIALAQIPGLPNCAQSCVSIPAECQTTDFKCICSDRNFITDISCCIAKSCNAADQQTVIKFASSLCGGYGVTVPTSATCASTASPTASQAPSSMQAASSAAAAAGNGTGNGTAATHTVTSVSVSVTTTTTASATAGSASAGGAALWMPDMLQAGGLAGAVAGFVAMI